MELRMNRAEVEEYEEVESPFAAQKPKLRTRKNVFNRPFTAESTVAPAVFETSSTRRSVGHPDQTELARHRGSELAQAEIDYLDEEEEEEEIETLPVKRSAPKAKPQSKFKKNIVQKIGWSVVGLLVLRLICMDRGVWDYFATEGNIREQQEELQSIQNENKDIKAEITRIRLDKNYQRQLAKEHLGVIAADEFLILFAGEVPEVSSSPSKNTL